jgi:hypothetical protein
MSCDPLCARSHRHWIGIAQKFLHLDCGIITNTKRGFQKGELSVDHKKLHEFEMEINELNKQEDQFKTAKDNATRRKSIASTQHERNHADVEGKDSEAIIAGFATQEKTADRGIQVVKDKKFNRFSVERDRIRAHRVAIWLKVHGELIAPLNAQITHALTSEKTELEFIDILLSEQSDAYKEMNDLDTEIDLFNRLATDNKMPGNVFVPVTEKLLGQYENEVRKVSTIIIRRFEASIKKVNAAFEARASARVKAARR